MCTGTSRAKLLPYFVLGIFFCLIATGLGNDDNREELRRIFEKYDVDHDGFITMDENLDQDKVFADEQDKPFDEEISRKTFERTDMNKDGLVSFEEMSIPRPDEQCKDLYGEFAEFDGKEGCRCMHSYSADINGTCILGSNDVCVKQYGPDSQFDGVNTCICRNGTIPDTKGMCIKGSDEACKAQFGEFAIFDSKNNLCTCDKGAVPDLNGSCVRGSTELCQEWYGPNTAFDGLSSCVCKKGFVYADGECFRGSNKVCASIIAGSRFDGVNDCKCRKSYEKDEARAICIKTNTSKSTPESAKPLPSQGTATVTIVEGKHLPKMDTHTKCDPFVVINLGSVSRRTKVMKKTYNPTWQETFRLSYNESTTPPQELEIEVYDWDTFGNGREFIGRISFALADLATDTEGWFDLQGPDGTLIRGHDGNTSTVYVVASFESGLPTIPWWESRPAWLLDTVRGCIMVWALLGVFIWMRECRNSKQIKED